MNLIKKVSAFIFYLEQEILPKLPSVPIQIYYFRPTEAISPVKSQRTMWYPNLFTRNQTIANYKSITNFFDIIQIHVSYQELKNLLVNDLFIEKQIDIDKTIIILLNTTIRQYFESKEINKYISNNQSLQFTIDYLSEIISAYFVFLSDSLNNNPNFRLISFFYKAIKKTALERRPELQEKKTDEPDKVESLGEKSTLIQKNISQYLDECNEIYYQRIFFLSGLELDFNNPIVLITPNYILRKLSNDDISDYIGIDYPDSLVLNIYLNGNTNSQTGRQVSFLRNYEQIKSLFPFKPTAVLEFRGKIKIFKIPEVELTLYFLMQSLRFYKLSSVNVIGTIFHPTFLEHVAYD